MPDAALLQSIQDALRSLASQSLADGTAALLRALGYRSDKTADLGSSAEELLGSIEQFRPELGEINRVKVQANCWKSCAFLFQLTNDEIPSLALNQLPLGVDGKLVQSQIESFVFLSIDLQGEQWSRTQLAAIARELNKRFPMPAIFLFRQEELFSLAVIDRRQNLRNASRDVIDSRVTVIKDVRLASPHRAHIDILASLALANLGDKRRPGNFRELYDAWIDTLSIQKLNKDFYQQLAWWYLWAVKEVEFPRGGGADRNAIGVIRLLTRLIFVWFIKERGLVPDVLFERAALEDLLKQAPDAAPNESNYYHAILQNLFFATLNQEMGDERRWAKTGNGMKGDYLISLVYRYQDAFKHPDKALQDCFAHVPFLNGGLFECLDEQLSDADLARRPELKELVVQEGKGWVLRVDGFSRRPDAQAKVPNKLFFGGTDDAALNTEFETKGKRYPVKGLIDLLGSYKFTVDENTPLDEEVALDPELLGKVFENLLASYNPDTRNTARKQSGSFYTPREVVDYMVDEALIAYFVRYLRPSSAGGSAGEKEKGRAINEVLDLGAGSGELDLVAVPIQTENQISVSTKEEDASTLEERLRRLLSYADEGNDFSPAETDKLIVAIESLKVLDPACGSGAFPMGVLQKLVHVLKKLDPSNALWEAYNRAPLVAQLADAKKIPDPSLHEAKMEEAESALDKFDRDFANTKHADYTRKLYLIEKSIYGVDIQPIAVQITKLRFFISLVVSQEVDKSKENWGITALPNLETKIIAADSLTPIREVKRGLVENFPLGHDIVKKIEADLHDASKRYFSARTSKTKRKYRGIIQNLREKLASELEQSGFPNAKAQQLVHWNPFDQNASADFFDPEWMFQLTSGFDITIGNPPYVNSVSIKKIKPKLRQSFGDFFDGNADLFTYFYRRGFDLLSPKGVLAYISSNKFMRTGYGAKTRKLLAREGELRVVIDFGEQPVFGASVDSAIVVVQKPNGVINPKAFKVVAIKAKEEIPIAGRILAERGESFSQNDLPDDGWLFEPSLIRNVLERMMKVGERLGDIVQGRFYYGIKTGFNDAFLISEEHKNALVREQSSLKEIIKPWLDGNEILRWRDNFRNQYAIIISSSANRNWPWSSATNEREAERIFAKTYPALWGHFSDHMDRLKCRADQGQFWWELRSCSYWGVFDKSKLVFNETSKELHAFIDDNKLYINKTGFIIEHPERHYLLGVLNSSALDYYYRHNFPAWGDPWNGGRIQFRRERMVDVPIPWPENSQRKMVTGCVKAITEIYQRTDGEVVGTNAVHFERLINGLVFELFFPEELHAVNIRLFDACEKAGIGKLATLQGDALAKAAEKLAAALFANNHPIYAMLFDLRALESVRIIEDKK
jgi:type I restriction-modification system DNA methylase subunit